MRRRCDGCGTDAWRGARAPKGLMMSHLTILFGMWSPGPTEIVVIAAVALLLFGSRLPKVGRSLGRSIVQFKKGLRDVQDDIDEAGDEDEPNSGSPDPGKKNRLPAPSDDEDPPAG